MALELCHYRDHCSICKHRV